MNALLGTVQHEKAKKSLESLKKLSAPTAQVMRDGSAREIPASKVVPGDIVLLDAGSMVAADGRLLECYHLQVNESSLTGESLPVEKQAAPLPTGPGTPSKRAAECASGLAKTERKPAKHVVGVAWAIRPTWSFPVRW